MTLAEPVLEPITYLAWTQNKKLEYIFVLFSVFSRLSAKIGPRNLPNGPGLTNAT